MKTYSYKTLDKTVDDLYSQYCRLSRKGIIVNTFEILLRKSKHEIICNDLKIDENTPTCNDADFEKEILYTTPDKNVIQYKTPYFTIYFIKYESIRSSK